MAKAELDILLNKLSGKLSSDDEIYISHRHGKTIISHYPRHKNPKSITPSQKANSSGFAQAVKQAKQELSDPARLAYWQSLYDAHLHDPKAPKYYATLRGFVIGQLTKNKEGVFGED